MIDYFISDPKKKLGLIWSYFLKVMNFLIFRDFYRIFSNFDEFIWILKIKKCHFHIAC